MPNPTRLTPPLKLLPLIAALLLASIEQSLAQETANEADVISLFRQYCVQCHGGDDNVEADVDLHQVARLQQLKKAPDLLETLIDVLETKGMPPEGEPAPSDELRGAVVAQLQGVWQQVLQEASEFPRTPLRRMNRFQYNNAVQDLLQLKVVVFPLPERLMREHGNYFQPKSRTMPDTVQVGSRPLGKSQLIEPRLGNVAPFPQDLRADNGFDNQADHLSLSPMLLESFMTLSRSIVESEDFNQKTCGIWPTFFAPPAKRDGADLERSVRDRLGPFLTRAFRRSVDPVTLDRYTAFVLSRLDQGTSFTDCMKEVTRAVLASPRFFYIYDQTNDATEPLDDFDLASRLSFFLWGSIPDDRLLQLAEAGTLQHSEVLQEEVERMLLDRKLKRFCDSFPGQWLQLDRIISSTPDPDKFPQFYFLKYRASMHMMLEPLLLFETVLIENRSVLELIDPDFSYRSDLLDAWYRDGSQGKAGSPVVVSFHRVPISDRRQGGVITNAAVMTMTSSPDESKPITRGAWVAGVILKNPPDPPPANVPPLAKKEELQDPSLTLRERFAEHRTRPDCASCHRDIDPLGFALENFDAAGTWRDHYEDGAPVDASGVLFGKQPFNNVTEFKDALIAEPERFARAFTSHLLGFALGRQVDLADQRSIESIVQASKSDHYRLHDLIKAIVLSQSFRH